MNISTYLLSALRLALVIAGAGVGARAWRRMLAPAWSGAIALLADAIGAIGVVVVVGEALGTFGGFHRWLVIVSLLTFGGLSQWLFRRQSVPRPSPKVPSRRTSSTDVVVVAASSALVIAQWSTWVARSVEAGVGNAGGPGNGDSLWYHMPLAAGFVRSGFTSHLQFLNGEALVTYYPANVSLLHAVGILATGSDVLSVFLNVFLVAVVLLAGWCIGESADAGAAGLAGAAIALTIPVVVVSEAGTAKDDILGLVGLLAALAFLLYGSRGRADQLSRSALRSDLVAAGYSGLAAGLALGSKLTFVAPVVALAVGLTVLTPRSRRGATLLRWCVAAFASGGYWYVRNLVLVGNPVPGLNVGIGSVALPRPSVPSMDSASSGLLNELGNLSLWRTALLPGLRTGFGSGWPLIIGIVVAAFVIGVVTLRGRLLIVPLVGLLAIGAFVITPGTVFGAQLVSRPGAQFVTANLFAFNLRYLLPAVAIGLVTVPLVAPRWRHGTFVVTTALGVTLLATQLVPQGRQSWADRQVWVAFVVGIVGFALVVGVPAGVRRWRRANMRTVRWKRIAFCSIAAGLLVVVVYPIFDRYEHNRYAALSLAQWANHSGGARIGYSGFVFSYPLFGDKLQNAVEMLGEHGPDGSWHPVSTCSAWRRQIRREHLDFVVVPNGAPEPGAGIDLSRWRLGLPGGEPPDEPPESAWSRTDPGERLVFVSNLGQAVYKVTGAATNRGCSSVGGQSHASSSATGSTS